MSSRRMMSAAALAVAVVAATTTPVFADFSKTVTGAFRGQVVVSKGDLPVGKNDKDTIAKIKKEQLKELTGTANEDVTAWHFHYTAFLSKTGANKLKIEFMKGGKLAADQQLDGVDPKSSVLAGDISINEDEGLAKGNTYTVQLVTPSGGVVSKTQLLMK
jgi:hypothetical protein